MDRHKSMYVQPFAFVKNYLLWKSNGIEENCFIVTLVLPVTSCAVNCKLHRSNGEEVRS